MDAASAAISAAEEVKAEEDHVHMHRFLDAVEEEAVSRVERDQTLSPASALMAAVDHLLDPPSPEALVQQEEAIGQLEAMASELHVAADSAHGHSLEERVVNAALSVLHGDAGAYAENDDARLLADERSVASSSSSPFASSPSPNSNSISDVDGEEAASDHYYDNYSDGASADDNQDDDGDYDDYDSDIS